MSVTIIRIKKEEHRSHEGLYEHHHIGKEEDQKIDIRNKHPLHCCCIIIDGFFSFFVHFNISIRISNRNMLQQATCTALKFKS
jgi:hypothetical protein